MNRKSKLNLVAMLLLSAEFAATAAGVQQQPDEAPELIPRRETIKPEHTQVLEAVHRTDVISVRFRDGLMVRLREGSLTDFGTGALQGAQDVLATVADGTWRRLHSVSEAKLDQWRQTAQQNLGRVVADLNLQFRLYLPGGVEPGAIIDAFNTLGCVELARPVPLPAPPPDCCYGPCPGPPTPDFEACQGYLGPATDGVDAECMWLVPGGTGTGIKFVDVEDSFNPGHQDYSATLLGPAPLDWELYQQHGTSAIGITAALSNGWGTTGIAYDSTAHLVTISPVPNDPSCNPPCTYEPGWAAAITRAVDLGGLGAGDVILLEGQISGPPDLGLPNVPVEWDEDAYDAIVIAVGSKDVTVVEAAGNGNTDLDDAWFCTEGCASNKGHCPFCPEYDSGAIIVGAGWPAFLSCPFFDRSRVRQQPAVPWGSNYGFTVDLQGWSTSIVTTGGGSLYNAEGENLYYTMGFGGTSGASAIIAGVCVSLQSAYKAATGTALEPEQVRDCLQMTGSPQQSCGACEPFPECENIGPRPNVAAAISAALPCLDCNANQTPDVCDIASGFSLDLDLDGVPDECCLGDLNGDGEVEAADLAILLGSWGPCLGCPGCPADFNCDGVVEAFDLAILLGNWGPCGSLGASGGSAPQGPGGDDAALIQALGVMGFADVDEFNAWTASVPTDEAHAATQQLLELLTE